MTNEEIKTDNAVNQGRLDDAGAKAEKYNKRLVESWKHDMEGLFVFAVLLSVISTAFLFESYNSVNVRLLAQVSLQLATSANGGTFDVLSFPSLPGLQSSVISRTLWFMSLGFSITCALVATFVQQRARELLHNFVGIDGSRIFYGPGRLQMQTAVKIVPFLLYTSLLLFFGGLAAFIIPVDLPMDIIAATLVGIIAAISCRIAVQYFHTSLTERHSHHHPVRAEEAQGADQPGFENVVEELRRQNADQRELLMALSDTWRADYTRQHEETMDAVRSTAREQVDFNVQGYLNEFSQALALEMRMLLGEVGKLREERRALQHELGYLLCMKSKYGPGGEFEPEWKPAPGGPQLGPNHRRSQHSWATWQPDPNLAPTPPTHEPTLLVPDVSSPGLFGPRSPSSSASKSPHPPTQSWATRQHLNSAPTLNKGEVLSSATWQPDPNLVPTPPAPEDARRQVQSWATWQTDPRTDPILASRPPPPEAPRARAAGPSDSILLAEDPKAGGDRDAVATSPPREHAKLPMVPEIRRSGV